MILLRTARARAVLALVTAIASAPEARAQSIDPTAIAEGLFQQGRELLKQQKFDQACPKLAESQRLDPKLGTLLNLAVCHEQQGRIATAWAEYTSAAAIAAREGQRERAEFARKQAATLDKKITHVTLQVPSSEGGLAVKLDDQNVTGAVFGVPLPLDPGAHRVTAAAPGKTTWSKSFEVPAEPAEITIPIPELAPAAVPEVPPPTPVTAPVPTPVVVAPPPPVRPPPPEPSSTPAVLMGVGFATAGVTLLIGAITGGVSLSETSTIKSSSTSCGNDGACPGESSNISSATTLANVSNAMFAIAGVGAVVGITGVVLKPKATSDARVTVTPVVGATSAGVRIGF